MVGISIKVILKHYEIFSPKLVSKLIEEFSKTTAAKEKKRTSVIFHNKTTNAQRGPIR